MKTQNFIGWSAFENSYEKESRPHPSIEQAMIREALGRLTPKQKRVWDLYNYDRMTEEEIAKKLGSTHQNISLHLIAIKNKVEKWVKYKELYNEVSEDMK